MWLNEYHADIVAIASLHRQAMVVCVLLAGFAMASAYSIIKGNPNKVERISAMLLYISSLAFVSTVCTSSIYLMAFARYEYIDENLYDLTKKFYNNKFFERVWLLNLITGSFGMIFLLCAMGYSGFSQSKRFGLFTASIATIVFLIMLFSVVFFLSVGYVS